MPVFHSEYDVSPHCLAQIKSLNKKIEDRNKQAAKIEKSIKVAKVSTPIARDNLMCVFDNAILTRQDNWHPALQDLVTSIGKRFSEAFDRTTGPSFIRHHLSLTFLGIGCAGELQLTPHEDYEKWAITILVKFRDTERLQQLTAHRQSGGVRCLRLEEYERNF